MPIPIPELGIGIGIDNFIRKGIGIGIGIELQISKGIGIEIGIEPKTTQFLSIPFQFLSNSFPVVDDLLLSTISFIFNALSLSLRSSNSPTLSGFDEG